MHTIGYAIIGTGYFGGGLARILAREEGARVVALLDPENGERVAAELGCAVETDLDALCGRPDVDVVVVATPNYLHKEPVLCATRHHKNVFCEKPIALSYADCEEMVTACQKSGVLFMAGHIMNFFNGVQTAKRLIQEGRIGRVLYCHSARNGWEPPQPSVSWKKMREKSGGHLYHHIHELDCIQFLMGPAQQVTMVGGNTAHHGEQFGDEDDMLLLTLEFGGGTYALMEYGSAFRWSEHYLLIQGTEGALRLDMKDCGLTLRTPGRVEKFLVHRTPKEDEDRTRIYNGPLENDGAILYGNPSKAPPLWLQGVMETEMAYLNRIMHGQVPEEAFKPLLDGSAARAAIATADAATLSLKENRKVSVREITGRA